MTPVASPSGGWLPVDRCSDCTVWAYLVRPAVTSAGAGPLSTRPTDCRPGPPAHGCCGGFTAGQGWGLARSPDGLRGRSSGLGGRRQVTVCQLSGAGVSCRPDRDGGWTSSRPSRRPSHSRLASGSGASGQTPSAERNPPAAAVIGEMGAMLRGCADCDLFVPSVDIPGWIVSPLLVGAAGRSRHCSAARYGGRAVQRLLSGASGCSRAVAAVSPRAWLRCHPVPGRCVTPPLPSVCMCPGSADLCICLSVAGALCHGCQSRL